MNLQTALLATALAAGVACSGAETTTDDQEETETESETWSQSETDSEPEGVIVINEVLARNASINTDDAGDNDDWLELYNAGNDTVDLTGWTMTDKEDEELELFALPDGIELAPGAFLLVWCDEDTDDDSDGEVHVDFKLTSDGETVRLYDDDGALMDRFTFPELDEDVGYGRLPDGDDELGETEPTPEEANEALE